MPSNLISFSVIIPVRNGASTLPLCLEAIRNSTLRPSEIIVVDDDSADDSGAIALKSGCHVIKISQGKGPMQPRFAGARIARSQLLVFIDSDVVIRENTLQCLTRHFENGQISAATGVLSRESRTAGLFTQYKNEYMNYIFTRRPCDTDFLYGSIFAVRSSDFIFFEPVNDPFGCLVSDSELGLRLKAQGKSILLDKSLEVEHLKRYGLRTLLKNDFVIPFMFARIFPRYAQRRGLLHGKAFSHASAAQTFAAAACAFAWGSLVPALLTSSSIYFYLSALLWAAFYWYWSSFLKKTADRGLLFSLKCGLLLALDAPVMFLGMIAGFIYNACSAVFKRGPDNKQLSTLTSESGSACRKTSAP